MNSLQTLLKSALEWINKTDTIALSYYKHDLDVQFKNDRSPVTQADRAIEAFLREEIEKRYPTHEIVGEEFGESAQRSNYRWIIDPIDGTKSFMRAIPTFSTLLGLEIDGEVQLGVASFPALGERIYAIKGGGAWWVQEKGMPPVQAHVSKVASLNAGMVMTTDVSKMASYGKSKAWQAIQKTAKSCLGYGDAYGYLLVATGRAELMLDAAMSIWDCGPLPVILSEAGGYFGDWHGQRTIYAEEAIATTENLLEEVLKLTRLDLED